MPPPAREIGDARHVGEGDNATILVADAELALSLERRACHGPRMWRARSGEASRLFARVCESRFSPGASSSPFLRLARRQVPRDGRFLCPVEALAGPHRSARHSRRTSLCECPSIEAPSSRRTCRQLLVGGSSSFCRRSCAKCDLGEDYRGAIHAIGMQRSGPPPSPAGRFFARISPRPSQCQQIFRSKL